MKAISVAAALAAAILAVPPAAHASTGTSRQLVEWVAMGDSYTAGAIRAAGEEFESPRDGCVRTDRSYPEVLRAALASQYTLRNVSCGGATIADIAERGQVPKGLHFPPLHTDPDHPFAPVAPQIQEAGPETGLITIGIGGNTLGFGEIIRTCVKLGLKSAGRGSPCRDHYRAEMARRLKDLAVQYDRMLTALHQRARNARIITVGYPHIVPEDTGKCVYGSPVGFATVTKGDLAWLRTNALEPLNDVIAKTTANHGDTYVDLYASSAGHTVCDKLTGPNWVEGMLDTRGRPALVHPNAAGHANAARLLERAIVGL
ncbi:hypothetical protein HNP84_004089 [Thermocatellispora tengchongensis]|uniref:SGNH hydrolase-type esterase domain-containing protein n=1 Tax=Thermocatellispora tengchongensis TaxID=1073253 RepID=A0A840PAY7_9ACTN|nr:SGNH/GDSL hydrolase family protein [Thermocatellispora tengchongensis]MBB5134357.1 hypothetical protein [Thermocatellispora tengchongensis]